MKIFHLTDDTNPGGVTRFLNHFSTAVECRQLGEHVVVPVRAGLSSPPKLDADVIVSHIVLSWKNLPFLMALRRRHAGVPLIHMEHSYSPAFEQRHVKSVRRFRAMLTVSLSLFDRVVTISQAQRDWLTSGGIVTEKKIALIPPFIDLSGFLSLAPGRSEIRAIGAFGRFDEQKGFDLLIPAFRMAGLENVRLEMFGDGPDRARLEALAGGDPNIAFHGFVDDPVAAMARVDAVAMPSRREPYGLVALEALAAGRKLLVSRVDGLIDHARNGALPVGQLTVEDWACALRGLRSVETSHRQHLARQFAANAGERFIAAWADLLGEVRR